MTLSRRLTIRTALLVVVLLALAAAAMWAVNALGRDVTESLAQYDRMRTAYTIGVDVWGAKQTLEHQPLDRDRASRSLLAARAKVREARLADTGIPDEVLDDWSARLAAASAVIEDDHFQFEELFEARSELNVMLSGVTAQTEDARRAVEAIEAQARVRRDYVTLVLGVIAGFTAVASIVLAVLLYRGVMRPMRRLVSGVRHVARGRLDHRITVPATDDEFTVLATDFNRMAEQLQQLYDNLESQVRAQSAELARSERLASVGYLAAGVAHEINNPLAIITAHAELALRDLADDDPRHDEVATIRDEAFRCKTITDRMLSLSRGGREQTEVDLPALVDDVRRQVEQLPQAEGRRVTVTNGSPLVIRTDPAQLRQVLLNLLVNAVECTDMSGRVEVGMRGEGSHAVLTVTDDGVGMDDATLDRIFEPFFTAKRGAPGSAVEARPGTGLGLSISHAIVRDLGGALTATSPGPGRGSIFTITLPMETGD